MTAGNIMKDNSVNTNFAAVGKTTRKQEDEIKIAEAFASIMEQNIDITNSMVDDVSNNTVSGVETDKSVATSYDKYSGKEKKINDAKSKDISEKVEESGETLEQSEENVVKVIADKYGVSEEEINKLLEEMGLSVLDLLNPQNLVNFIVQLTGVASGNELLLDEKFLTVMETLEDTAASLMKDLNVDVEGLQEVINQMNMVEENTELPASFQETIENVVEDVVNAEKNMKTTEDVVQVSDDIKTTDTEMKVEVEKYTKVSETDVQVETDDVTAVNDVKEETSFTNNQDNDGNSLFNNQSQTDTVMTHQTMINVNQASDVSQTTFGSYMSTDTIQIIEQIVEQMRVSISADTTSMEMQLNPENLGKVYVNISAEEGVINAQFRATNEIVKEALETQIATLRENLNQAGVKVDAIEVTVQTHQFDQNLEQGQGRQFAEPDKKSKPRRIQLEDILSMDLMDELEEDEQLAAQMMLANGNTVDYTA